MVRGYYERPLAIYDQRAVPFTAHRASRIIQFIDKRKKAGYYWAVESGCYQIDEDSPLSRYFDYERFGFDNNVETTGGFTSHGWLEERR